MMFRLHAFTIRRKLVLISMATSMVALVVACGAFATYDAYLFRRRVVLGLSLRAQIFVANSTAALAFDDERAATEILAALARDPHMARAILYASDDHVFAVYRRADVGTDAPPVMPSPAQYFTREGVVVWEPVIHQGERLGTLYLESDLTEIQERLRRYAVIVALVMLGAGLIAFLVASRLHHVISGPIHELVRAAKAVSTEHDYSLRVPTQSGDELGVLITGFNEMLDEIESRDHALLHAQDELELRVDERTSELRTEIREREQTQAELERARDAAESATRAKSAFLANMSHEIRTPMNVIIGMTDMALDGELVPETRDYLGTVRRATLGLLGIINDILDCSKIEAGKVTLESKDVDLRALVAEAAELFALTAREKGLALVTTVDPALPACVRADPVRLRQVLTNLVGNAVKFTERGGITVELGAALRTPTGVRLHVAVRDTGIGVPADRRDSIFDSFTQADNSTTRMYGGTGLGLTICRELVRLMGGRIFVESEVGKGSTFWFEIELPVGAPTEAEPPAFAASA